MKEKIKGYISPESLINEILPREHEAYFTAIHDKHFNPEKAIGSLFTEVKNLNELLIKTIEQRGSLSGDDREKFIAMGISPESLMPQCRYLKVETRGEVGISKASDLPLDTKVKVIRTKPNAPCSLVIEGGEIPEVNFGTIIIGPNEKQSDKNPEPSTKEMIWTVHPGPPVRPATEDYWNEGTEITVKEVINRLGKDIYLNVQKKK